MIVPNINRWVFTNIDDIVIFACQLWPKHDFNADLYLLQRKIWRDKTNINMTMNGGQIRFYLCIYCRILGILWYMYK
jgi:hypothetical protein